MFAEMALGIWKWQFPWPLRIFSTSVGNDFQPGPRKSRNAPFSNVQHFHPLRGTACVGRRRPAQAVGAFGRGHVGTAQHVPEPLSPARIVFHLVEVLERKKKILGVPVPFIRWVLTSP